MSIVLPPNLPVGVRFHPTEEELITRYLRPKILGQHFDNAIAEIDICRWEPWELPDKSKIKSKDRMWWFICRPDYKNPSGRRLKRTTNTGFWKVTGQERAIKDQDNKACIGKKRTLVFHSGPTPGIRTNWVMQEYSLTPNLLPQERASYVICRLKRKTDDKVDTPGCNRVDPSPSHGLMSDLEISGPLAAIQRVHGQTEANHGSNSHSGSLRLTSDDISRLFSEDNAVGDGFESLNHESGESPEEFADGLIVEPDEIFQREVISNFLTGSSLSTSKRSYFTDAPNESDTDAEGINGRLFMESPGLLGSPISLKKARQMRMVNAPSKPLRTSATSEYVKQGTVVAVSNQPPEEESLSNCLAKPVEKLDTTVPSELPIVDVRGSGRYKRIQIQQSSSVSCATTFSNKGKEASDLGVTTTYLPRKGKELVESDNVLRPVKSANNYESPAGKILTFLEFSPVSSCNCRSVSELWLNTIVGAVLFVVFLLFGSW